jgi:ketosteroid isomerase-like protein
MQAEVLKTAQDLIDAFEANDRDAYFGFFAPEASFIFHNTGHVMESRAAYEAEYDAWVREAGFEVLECTSSRQTVQIHGKLAVFTHQLFTRVSLHDEEIAVVERESIIFDHQDGKWVAVHEHLSLMPEEHANDDD